MPQTGKLLVRPPKQRLDALIIHNLCAVDLGLEHEALGVYQQVSLTPLHLLATIVTALFSAHRGTLHRLRIHHARAGLGISLQAYSQAFSESPVDPLPGTIDAPFSEVVIDGLITNDKFCFTRRSRLKLRPKRRGYPSRDGVRRGGINETELDRSARDGRSRRRRPSLGPSLCAPPPLGGTQANHDEGGGA